MDPLEFPLVSAWHDRPLSSTLAVAWSAQVALLLALRLLALARLLVVLELVLVLVLPSLA